MPFASVVAVAALATADGLVFELAWFGTDVWASELARVAVVPEELPSAGSRVPGHLDLPFELADAAVVGYLRESDGEELPRAFLVLQQGVDPNDPAVSAEALMEWVAERVTPYKKIRMVEFIDAIPKSSSGKILRKDLRARESAA